MDQSLSSPHALRLACRSGVFDAATSGYASGYVQGNLAVLPAALAADFEEFCKRNPKPCPIIGVSDIGSPMMTALGVDLDIRTDLPRYCVWQNGTLVDQPQDIRRWWQDDLVAFVIGCSHSFEDVLMRNGLGIRHIQQGTTVPMYKTTMACTEVGPFSGNMVVSMRPFQPRDAIRAIEVTSRYPEAHGAPVHMDRPGMIGIKDISAPDFGDPSVIHDDELPVFWACGVTALGAVSAAKPALAITHAPGRMVVTDLPLPLRDQI